MIRRENYLYIPLKQIKGNFSSLVSKFVLKGRDRKNVFTVDAYKIENDNLVLPREADMFFPELKLFGKIEEWDDGEDISDAIEFDNISFDGRPHQVPAWKALSENDRGILSLGCGGGKTILAVKKIGQVKKKTLVVVPQNILLEQWVEALKKHLGIDAGEIRQGRYDIDAPVVVAVVHSLLKKPLDDVYSEKFGFAVFDEVHHFAAKQFSKSITMLKCPRLGLTATLKRKDNLQNLYFWHIGKVIYQDLSQDLKPSVYFIKYPKTYRVKEYVDKTRQPNMMKLDKLFAYDNQRISLICKIASRAYEAGRKVMIFTLRTDHALFILNTLKRKFALWDAGMVTGKVPRALRRNILNDKNPLVVTLGIAQEGLDLPILDTLIYASPVPNYNRIQQSSGRVLRKHPDKKDPVITVIYDYRIREGMINGQVMQRYFKKQGYDIHILSHERI